jgi:hypothetical protein
MTTAASQTYQTQTAQIKNARRFVKRNLGHRVYIAYGTADVYVDRLRARRQQGLRDDPTR